MSNRTVNTQQVTPPLTAPVNQQDVNPPTSTAQTDAQLTTTTSTTDSDVSEPKLSNKEASKSPLKDDTDPVSPDSAVLEHSAAHSPNLTANSSQLSAPTTTAVHVNSPLSMTELTEAASAGDANAQFELGKRYSQGIGVSINHEVALKWYSQSAEQGHFKAQHNLAGMYYYGNGVEKDYLKAAEWYKKAANQGTALSQYNLSLLYQRGKGVEKNDVIAFIWCLEAANQGHAEAQYELGMLYQLGQGVNPDPALEHTWFSKASDQGNAEAQYELALIYLYGRKEAGINKDLSKAIDLFLKAADHGHAKAQCQLGWIYKHGTDFGFDISKDYDKAVEWLRLAADQGNVGGQEMLAELFEKGHGVKQSDEDAVFWYTKAAEQDSNSAQEMLAHAYKNGKGVKKDLSRSVYWQMKCNLNEDGDSIRGTFLDISLSAGLTEFIAKNLIEGKEFKKVTKLNYTQNSFSDDEILGVCSLIRKNLKINSLILNSFNKLSNTQLLLIIDASDTNTNLTEIDFGGYFSDGIIKDKIDALLARNVAIAELRKYVLDYPLIHTASFALDPLNIMVDKTIVSYMINGVSKEDTKLAIDELLRHASVYELEAEVKNKVN